MNIQTPKHTAFVATAGGMSPTLSQIIAANAQRDFGYGMDGARQVFAAAVEARTYKRMAAEALLICGQFRDSNLPRKGWQWWFDRAQHMRRQAERANG